MRKAMQLLKWLTRKNPSAPDTALPATTPAIAGEETSLAYQKEMAALRLDLQASEQKIQTLRQEVERLQSRQEQILQETVALKLETLMKDLAAPASQILTQADLLENQGKAVQARDVLTVARRMVRALERAGVTFVEPVGQQVAFDPNQHTPISASTPLQAGQPAVVRFAGVSFQGKLITKAIVE
jgi:molecular chaperone GrpE (heat shock protein)